MAKSQRSSAAEFVAAQIAKRGRHRCVVCGSTTAQKALTELLDVMTDQRHRLSVPAIAEFLRTESGLSVSRHGLARHLGEHEPLWQSLKAL